MSILRGGSSSRHPRPIPGPSTPVVRDRDVDRRNAAWAEEARRAAERYEVQEATQRAQDDLRALRRAERAAMEAKEDARLLANPTGCRQPGRWEDGSTRITDCGAVPLHPGSALCERHWQTRQAMNAAAAGTTVRDDRSIQVPDPPVPSVLAQLKERFDAMAAPAVFNGLGEPDDRHRPPNPRLPSVLPSPPRKTHDVTPTPPAEDDAPAPSTLRPILQAPPEPSIFDVRHAGHDTWKDSAGRPRCRSCDLARKNAVREAEREVLQQAETIRAKRRGRRNA